MARPRKKKRVIHNSPLYSSLLKSLQKSVVYYLGNCMWTVEAVGDSRLTEKNVEDMLRLKSPWSTILLVFYLDENGERRLLCIEDCCEIEMGRSEIQKRVLLRGNEIVDELLSGEILEGEGHRCDNIISLGYALRPVFKEFTLDDIENAQAFFEERKAWDQTYCRLMDDQKKTRRTETTAAGTGLRSIFNTENQPK